MTNSPTDLEHWFEGVPDHRRPLAAAMARNAQETSRRLHAAQMNNLPLQEESITEHMLLELKQTVPGLEIRSLTRHEEAVEGADWEFWIEGDRQWFSFLVQAKKAKRTRVRSGPTYDVGYASGSAETPQINLLRATSAARNMPAVYAFYNDPVLAADFVRTGCRDQPGFPDGMDGITTLSVGTTSWLYRDGWDGPLAVADAANHAFPWACLAACPAADTCLSTVWPKTATDPESMGFAADTSDEDPALSVARAVHQVEKAHWVGTFSTQTLAKPSGWGVRNAAPDYVPRPEQDPESLDSYPYDGLPAPKYIVAVWRQHG